MASEIWGAYFREGLFFFVGGGGGGRGESKVADQDGRNSEIIMQLLRCVTASRHYADVKGDIFRSTIYPPSLIVIAFIAALHARP